MTDVPAARAPMPRAVVHAPSPRTVLLKRLVACLAGGVVLAMMVGSQEGSETDYGYAFRKSVFEPRIVVFLAIGVLLFFAITYWPSIVPYLTRPGFWPLLSGGLAVLAAITLMHWYDPVGDGKFSATAGIVSQTSNISAIATAYFGWLAWAQLIAVVAVGGGAIILGLRWLAFVVAAVAVLGVFVTYLAHQAVDSAGRPKIDHSLGYAAAMMGYLVIACAMMAAATTEADQAHSREFVGRLLGFRPGLPLVVLGAVMTVLAFAVATWFSPGDKNTSLSGTHDLFAGSGLASLAYQELGWLSWVLLVVAVTVAGAATWFRNRVIGWGASGICTAASLLTLLTLYDLSKLAAHDKVDAATGPWQNLGSGGWMACAGLFLVGAGGFVAATAPRDGRHERGGYVSSDTIGTQTKARKSTSLSYLSAPGAARS